MSQLLKSGGQSIGTISPSNEYSGLISFRIDLFTLVNKGHQNQGYFRYISEQEHLWCPQILQLL